MSSAPPVRRGRVAAAGRVDGASPNGATRVAEGLLQGAYLLDQSRHDLVLRILLASALGLASCPLGLASCHIGSRALI